MNLPECPLVPVNRHLVLAQIFAPWKKHESIELVDKFQAFMYAMVVAADPESKIKRGDMVCFKKGQAEELLVDGGMRLLNLHESFICHVMNNYAATHEFEFKDLGVEGVIENAKKLDAEINRRKAAMFEQTGQMVPVRLNG